MRFTVREIFGIFLVLIIGLLSLGAWYSFVGMMLLPGVVGTWQTVIFFSALIAVFFVGAVVWGNPALSISGAVFFFLPSLAFIFSWVHLVVSCIAVGIAWWSIHDIQNEVRDRVRFHFYKSIRSGRFFLIFALSLVLSSGYFAFSQNVSWEELVPRYHISEGTSFLTLKVASFLYPDLKKASDNRATVDEFLLNMKGQQEGAAVLGQSLSDRTMEALKNVLYGFPASKNSSEQVSMGDLDRSAAALVEESYVRSGREQISALVGRAVSGDEKIADIFLLAIEHKVAALFGKSGAVAKGIPSDVVPLILAAILFLTLVPFGTILGPLFTLIGFLIFSFARTMGWVKIVSVERNQDILEE